MACFQRASPALTEILLKLYREENPAEFDHHLHEFGSVEYYIQSSQSHPHHVYLSISTPLLSQGGIPTHDLSQYTIDMINSVCSNVMEVVNPARDGFLLTLRLNFANIPRGKEKKILAEVASVQALMMSSQLREMFQNISSRDTTTGMYRPIKLVYQPRQPFFIIRQPQKITAVFPMRFREESDVTIATAFFQELMDVGSTEKWIKAPPCTWSPVPPPELRGEPFEDLSTNGGFVSFDILPRHVDGKRLDKTVWSVLNFHAYVNYHIKSTRGFIQRRMEQRLERLVEVLQSTGIEDAGLHKKVQGNRCVKKLASLSKCKVLIRRCREFSKKIKRIRCQLKIHAFNRFRRRWLTIPKFASAAKYTKLH